METPQSEGAPKQPHSEGSTLRRGEHAREAIASTASLDHLQIADLAPGGLGPAQAGALEPDEKAETVIRRPESGGSSVRVSSRPSPATPAEVAGVLLGSRLSHFHLEELIGGGGMGAVFRARDERLDRTVAIKVIPFVGDDPEMQRRFRNEAQSAARLDHPNIARVFDVGMFEGWRYIVFEHIEGTNIRDLVARDGVLSIDDAVFYTRQIAEALHHASGRGVVHRDVKPSNILVSPDGNTKLVDMGLARSEQLDMSGDMTASGVTLGTFDYISPEQARDPRDADVRSDLYSLGCTLYFMLTGRPPYPGGTMLQKLLNHGNAPPPEPRAFRPEVSDDLTAIIHKMLAKSPSARYQRAVDLVADLRELAIREGLQRAQSQGTLTISRDDLSGATLATHLPWMVAASLLLVGALVLQVIASLRGDAFTIQVPTSAAVMRPWPGGGEIGPLAEPAVPPSPRAGSDTQATGLAPTGAEDDVAAQPPPAESDRIARLRDRPVDDTAAAGPREVAAFPRVDKIVIGNVEPTPGVRIAATLTEALDLAVQHDVNAIEIAEAVIESEPIRIPRDIRISSRVGYSEIRFVTGPLPPMQRAVMINIGSNRIEFQNLHLTWNVRSAAREGGTLMALSDNKRVRLSNCTITIENQAQRDEVFVMEVSSPAPLRGSNGLLGADPPALRPGADFIGPLRPAELLQGTEPLASPPRPPLVAIELNHVAVRGEATFINMVDAAELQLNWDNGLLAVSRRMLEVAGAKLQLPAAGNQIRLVLRQVTAFTAEGLVRTRLGPSGEHPMLINRDSQKTVFRSLTSAPHIEFIGLPGGLDDPDQLVLLSGADNAYDHGSEEDPSMLSLVTDSGDQQVITLNEMSGLNRRAWAPEGRPQLVHWSQPLDLSEPASRLEPADFLQDGTLVLGFDPALLPNFPDRRESRDESLSN